MATETEIERLFAQNANLFLRMSEAERLLAVQGERDRRTETDMERALTKLESIAADLQEIKAAGAEHSEQLRHLAERVQALELPRTATKAKGGAWGTVRDLFGRWTPASLIVAVIVCVAAAYVFLEESISDLITAGKVSPD